METLFEKGSHMLLFRITYIGKDAQLFYYILTTCGIK